MSNTYNNDVRMQMGPGLRPPLQHYGAPEGFMSQTSSRGKRIVLTAVAAAVGAGAFGAGAVVAFAAFDSDDARPEPAVSTVLVPGYSGYPTTPETAQTPNAAVLQSNSPRETYYEPTFIPPR